MAACQTDVCDARCCALVRAITSSSPPLVYVVFLFALVLSFTVAGVRVRLQCAVHRHAFAFYDV